MNDGSAITGNINTSLFGGGVWVIYGDFIMSGGSISGNTTNGYGGGVLLSCGNFTMSSGLISSNTANGYGGGVLVSWGVIAMNGGVITGYASDNVNGNAVIDFDGIPQNNLGHAVYCERKYTFPFIIPYRFQRKKRKEITAVPEDKLFFNGSNGKFSGNWDK